MSRIARAGTPPCCAEALLTSLAVPAPFFAGKPWTCPLSRRRQAPELPKRPVEAGGESAVTPELAETVMRWRRARHRPCHPAALPPHRSPSSRDPLPRSAVVAPAVDAYRRDPDPRTLRCPGTPPAPTPPPPPPPDRAVAAAKPAAGQDDKKVSSGLKKIGGFRGLGHAPATPGPGRRPVAWVPSQPANDSPSSLRPQATPSPASRRCRSTTAIASSRWERKGEQRGEGERRPASPRPRSRPAPTTPSPPPPSPPPPTPPPPPPPPPPPTVSVPPRRRRPQGQHVRHRGSARGADGGGGRGGGRRRSAGHDPPAASGPDAGPDGGSGAGGGGGRRGGGGRGGGGWGRRGGPRPGAVV